MNSDVVIVGGGIAGFLSACELLRHGVRATIVERSECGRESSWAGGGILSPLYPWRYAEPVTRLASWGQPRYEALADTLYKATGIDPEWLKSGLLMLDTGEQAQATVWARQFGIDLKVIGKESILSISASIVHDNGGIWMENVAQMRNPRLMRALKAYVLDQGVKVLEHRPVTGLKTEQGRISGITTEQGDMLADKVLIAGGAWSRSLLGESLGKGLKVEPVRGQMLLFKAKPELLRTMVLSGGKYLIPRKDGRILVGSTLEYVGFQKVTTEQALTELKAAAFKILPELQNYPIEMHWAGLRPGSPEGVPYIGEHPQIKGLFVNTGHFRNGVVLGLASARLVSDLMTGQPPILEPAPYQIST